MDLLSALPEEIFNEVVSCFSRKDVLKASLVCKVWYQMFGQSKECMQKLTLKYHYRNCNNDLDPLLKSERKYQNVIIGFEGKFLQESGFEPKIKAILKKFSKSIVKLHTSHDFHRICEFPNLKELKYKNFHHRDNSRASNYFSSNGLLAMCPNISKLDVTCRYLNKNYTRILQGAINNMRNLTSLAVDPIFLLYNFQTDDCKFKLEEFGADCFYLAIQIANNFLKFHQSTLKYVKIAEFEFRDVGFVLSNLPKLHTLHITHLEDFGSDEVTFPDNSTITNFIIESHIYEEYRHKLAEIFTKLKNLQQVRLDVLYSCFIPELFACESLTLVKYRVLSELATEDQKNYMNNNGRIKFIEIP